MPKSRIISKIYSFFSFHESYSVFYKGSQLSSAQLFTTNQDSEPRIQ